MASTERTGMAIDATASLLARVFPQAPQIGRPEYLRWLYVDSPFGPVIEANLDDEAGRAGHYALVPIDLTVDGQSHSGALSLNTAVDERARGGGVFVRLASEAIEAARSRGIAVVLGVANANSTPGFLRRLEFQLVAPLPATVLVPTPGRRGNVRSAWAGDAILAIDDADDLDALLRAPAHGVARSWTAETLRWRLAAPGARYALHRSAHALLVSTVDRRQRVPVAVLLKLFASAAVGARERRALVRAACRFHRAPFALHVGFNDLVAFRGPPLPERLRSSPLNLILRELGGTAPSGPIVRWELLDFDAY
jgi:GNAT superfamily N-acetyltransferase